MGVFTIMKLGAVLKKIQKVYESRDTPLSSAGSRFFFTGNQQILLYQEMQIVSTGFFSFFEYLKIILINMVKILMISAKVATPGLTYEKKTFCQNSDKFG